MEYFYSDAFQKRIGPIIDQYGLVMEDRGDIERVLKTPHSFEFDHDDGYN